MSKLVILSDLHIWGPEDPLYRAFLRFLETKLDNGDKFFILGDLFDLFIGSKELFRDRYAEIVNALKALDTRGVEVFYIEGNHDFQLENVFEDMGHVRLYADTIQYEWDGRRFFFCHGDRINAKDYGYQAFRFLTRSLLFQCVIEIAPGKLIDRIGTTLSKASRGQHPDPGSETIRAFRNFACEQIESGFDFVGMGHSHFLDDMRFRVGNHEGQYVNVGYPRKHKKFLELKSGAAFFELLPWEELSLR